MIRPGTPDDAEAVARVQIATWQTAYAHVFTRDRLAAMSHERAARHWRENPPFVAEVDDQIVGFVSVGPSGDEGEDAELFAIYVLPEHWGTGIGRALIEAGEEHLRERGHRKVSLWVLEDNPRARAFYERAGWSIEQPGRSIEIFGVPVDEVRYSKDLGSADRRRP